MLSPRVAIAEPLELPHAAPWPCQVQRGGWPHDAAPNPARIPPPRRQASLRPAQPASPASMPRGVGAASRGRDPHLGEPLPLSNPRGSWGLDREPPGSRIPSGPSRAPLHLPKGPDQGVGPANRCTDHTRTITGAHHEVVPDRHPNLLFCFVAPSPEHRVPTGCTCRLLQPSERSGHEVGRWVASTVKGRDLESRLGWRPSCTEVFLEGRGGQE